MSTVNEIRNLGQEIPGSKKKKKKKARKTLLKGRSAGWTQIINYVNLQQGNENLGSNWRGWKPSLGFLIQGGGPWVLVAFLSWGSWNIGWNITLVRSLGTWALETTLAGTSEQRCLKACMAKPGLCWEPAVASDSVFGVLGPVRRCSRFLEVGPTDAPRQMWF